MENLTKEERELIADLHALRRVDFTRYTNLLDAFDIMIKYEAQHPLGRPSCPQPEKVVQFSDVQRRSR